MVYVKTFHKMQPRLCVPNYYHLVVIHPEKGRMEMTSGQGMPKPSPEDWAAYNAAQGLIGGDGEGYYPEAELPEALQAWVQQY